MLKTIKSIIERNKSIADICRWIYRVTILKYNHKRQNANFLIKGEAVLEKIHSIFSELGIQYWLEYGTLLGAFRDKSFISHDLDIDLGLFLSDYSDEIEKLFVANGFKKLRKIAIDNGEYGLEESYLYEGVVIDFFYFQIKEKQMYSHGFINEEGVSWAKTIQDRGGLIVREIYFPYNGFETIKFLNGVYPVPCKTNEHLKAFYGEDFMVKKSNWKPLMANNVKTLKDKIGVMRSYE